jgi:HK97 family phage major capsid protein
MALKTYVVAKSFMNLPVQSEHEFEEADVVELLSSGKLLVKDDNGMKEAKVKAMSDYQDIAQTILKGLTKALGESSKKGLDFSVVGQEQAKPKEEQSLRECLQAIGWAGSTSHDTMGGFYTKGMNLLSKKYNMPVSKEFNGQFDESTRMEKVSDDGTVEKAQTTQAENIGAYGGFALKPEFSQTFFTLMGMKSVLVERVTKRIVTTLDYYEPTKDYSLGGNGASPFLAGMTGSWLQENMPFNNTVMAIRQIHLKMNLFGALTVVPRQLLFDNAYAFESMLTENFAETAAFYLAQSIFNGSGAAQPSGMTNATSALPRNRTAAANGALLSDLATMVSLMLPDEGAQNRYFWMVSPSAYAALLQLTDGTGRVIFLPNFPATTGGPATVRTPMMLFGMPVVRSQFPSSSGTARDICLIDPMPYLLGLRQELEVASSEHVNFQSNQMTYRFLLRADGKSALNTYLTLANGDTVAPVIYLN